MIYDEGCVEKPITNKYRNVLRFIRKSLLDLVSLCNSVHSDAVEICTSQPFLPSQVNWETHQISLQ